jgi:orotidine-5'-phosphate decarboxylase
MIPAEKIIVALDYSTEDEVVRFFKLVEGQKVWMKVGMELFYSLGPSVIHEAKNRGFKLFLDLKLHDIPNTVGQSIKALTKLPIDMINIHAAGGSEMMKRAADAVHQSSSRPLLIAVTQLTSTSVEQMNIEQRICGDIVESVVHYAKLAKENGCDGVVSSPHEIQAIKLVCGSPFLTVTPGIRPVNANKQDQTRVTTPQEALLRGTDFMVIGRPITQALNPREALESIIKGS